jgi:putative ABC transport system permease protein
MIQNYIKTAFRSLLKNKGFTFINVFGLALGLATCLLIVFYVFDELSYDRYNVKADRVFRLNYDIKFGGVQNPYAITPPIAGAALKADFPGIEQVARFRNRGGNKVKKGAQNIQEDRMVYADNSILDVFTLPIINGDATHALTEPHTVIVTEDIAKKYFGKTDVVGQVLTVNDTSLFKITAVIKNIPQQSHFHFDFIMSMPTILAESRDNSWLFNNFNTYILLKPGVNYRDLAAKLPEFLHRHAGAQLQSTLHMDFAAFEKSGNYLKFTLIPLKNIHLQSAMLDEFEPNGDITYVYIFSAIAIFILLIACVNFMNLSTARSANRAREVGVRKVLGSPRKYLVAQFLTESILVTLVGAAIAVFAAWALLPLFNQLSGKQLTVTPQILAWLIPALLIIIVVIGCLAGSYPAIFLSGFQPINVLKGKLAAGFKGGMLRSFLVVFQFAISIFLIIGTLVIYNQLKYIQNKDLGYNRDHILIVKNVWALGNGANAFKQEIKELVGVQSATLSNSLPTDNGNDNTTSFFKNQVIDQKQAVLSHEWFVDEDYVSTLGIKMIAGRNFSKDMATDTSAAIINESFAKLMGDKKPVGQFVYTPANSQLTKLNKLHIIGVMKDFNFRSLKENVPPLVLNLTPNMGVMSIRVHTADIPGLIAQIKSRWKDVSHDQQLSYTFMDQEFDAIYRSEQRMGAISIAFTSLAIIIACLGLFGLAAYAAEQRTKEIGIRKVLGANISTIVSMLSKDFIKLVIISILIAVPFAWWAMSGWLQSFAYRQNMQWWVPVTAGLSAIAIAFITISYQSIKAALTNPVKSLKSE